MSQSNQQIAEQIIAKAEQSLRVCAAHRPEGLAALRAEVAEGADVMLEAAVDRCIHKETSLMLSSIAASADRGIVPRPAWPPELWARVMPGVSLEHSIEDMCAFCTPEELTGRAADMEAGLL